MRVLILNPILFTSDNNGNLPKVPSIKDTMILGMCRGFLNLGHDVTLIASDDFRPSSHETYEFEVIFMKSVMRKIFKPVLIPLMPGLIPFLINNHTKFDLIISSEVFSFTSFFASLICPSKTIIWHELTQHNRKFKRIPSIVWYNLIARLFMNKISIVPRSLLAHKFISQYCPKTHKVNVDHGIDLNHFKVCKDKKRQFICISQLIPRKNVDQVIDKFSQFVKCELFSDFKLYIAGRGEMIDLLKSQVKRLNIEDNVLFLGFVDHDYLNKVLGESQALLLNTSRDLNVVSITESLASGTPVITNEVPALADFIRLHKLGLVNNTWGVNELKEIISNNEYRDNCINMREKFSNTVAADSLIKIFVGQL